MNYSVNVNNPYFNLTVENISKAEIETIEKNDWLNESKDIMKLLPSTIEDCWELEDGVLFCKAEYADELANLSNSIGNICYFLSSEGFTFKFEDKLKVAWNKLKADLVKSEA